MPNSLPPIQLREADATLLMQTIHKAVVKGQFIRGCEPTISNLIYEVGRATIVPENGDGETVATLGSQVVFEDCSTGEEFRCRLVAPDQANGSEGQLSILSPLGAALVGRSPGDTVLYGARLDSVRILSVARRLEA